MKEIFDTTGINLLDEEPIHKIRTYLVYPMLYSSALPTSDTLQAKQA